jgi:hypothetical protein
MAVRLTMGLGASSEVMALDPTGKASSFGRAADIDNVASLKHAHIYLMPHLDGVYVRCLELTQVPEHTHLLQMPLLRRVQPFRLAEAKLDRIVALLLHPLDLDNKARPSLDGSDRLHPPIFPEYLGHADLSSDYSFNHFSTFNLGPCTRG